KVHEEILEYAPCGHHVGERPVRRRGREPYVAGDVPQAVTGEGIVPPRYAERVYDVRLREREAEVRELHPEKAEVEPRVVGDDDRPPYERQEIAGYVPEKGRPAHHCIRNAVHGNGAEGYRSSGIDECYEPADFFAVH